MSKSSSTPSSGVFTAKASRRNFLMYTGAGIITTGLILTGCNDDNAAVIDNPGEVNLGTGDLGILNYAYALEQLEAAFYTTVMENNFFSGATDQEKRILEDIMKHEVAHRDFFKAAISTVGEPIPGLEVDFSSINFSDRSSVLGTAKVFENLGVAAYNGAGKLLQNKDFLVVAGKIVSVEARHAAVISNLISPGTTAFVDVVNAQGLDGAMMPSDVLMAAKDFIKTPINASNLPTA